MMDFTKLLKGTAYLAAGAQLGRLLNFFQVLLLTRQLGSAGYGEWSLIQALPAMLMVVTDLGLNSVMLREIAADKMSERASLQKVFSLKLLLAPVYILITTIFALASSNGRIASLIAIYSGSVVLGLCGETLLAVYRARQRYEFEAFISLVRDVTLCLILIATLFFGAGILWLVVATAIHNALFSTILLINYRRESPVKLAFSTAPEYRRLLTSALPFAAFNLLNPLSMQIALVMVGTLSSVQAVGIYNAAFRIVVFLYFIPNALQRTLLPNLAAVFQSARDVYNANLQKAARLVIATSLPLAIGLFLTSRQTIKLLFSAEFTRSAEVLRLLALSIPFYYLRVVMNAALYATGREKLSLLFFATSAVLNTVVNVFLINSYGVIGAAVGTIFTEVFLCACYVKLAWAPGAMQENKPFYLKVITAAVAMTAIVIIIPEINLFLRVVAGALVYPAALIFLKAIEFRSPRSPAKLGTEASQRA
jgi:O-antigen/teichoic acid export membrane protein